jgi:hypothetical protein
MYVCVFLQVLTEDSVRVCVDIKCLCVCVCGLAVCVRMPLVYLYMYACICVLVYVCMHACAVYVCMHLCAVYVCTRYGKGKLMRLHQRKHVCIHTYIHIMCIQTKYIHTYTYIHTYIHKCIYIHIYICIYYTEDEGRRSGKSPHKCSPQRDICITI